MDQERRRDEWSETRRELDFLLCQVAEESEARALGTEARRFALEAYRRGYRMGMRRACALFEAGPYNGSSQRQVATGAHADPDVDSKVGEARAWAYEQLPEPVPCRRRTA